MSSKMLAAVCMNARTDKNRNVEKAFQLVEKAAQAGADWVLLPEIFHFFGPYKDLYAQAEEEGGPLLKRLGELAKKLNIVLFAGSIGERPDADSDVSARSDSGDRRVYNTLYVFGRQGELLGKYRKTHLFNLYGSDGKKLYCEEDGFIAGNLPVAIDVEGYRVGLSICYDIRFGEYYSRLSQEAPMDVIVVPAAFTLKTGMDHWELMLRARAVEQQAFVFASNQFGSHGPDRETYGHSMIVDPWGIKIADTGANEGFCLGLLSRERITEVRSRLPALKNRRPDVYKA